MEFQRRLLQVERLLSAEDVQVLAFLCTDLLCRDLSSVASAKELFSMLMEQDLLSEDDWATLTELLHISQRPALVRQLGLGDQGTPVVCKISPYRLLFELSENITHSDLKSMKFLLYRTLPRYKLQDNMTTLQLFLEMEKEDHLSVDNLHTLEKTLRDLRPDLAGRINNFISQNGLISQETAPSSTYFETQGGSPLNHTSKDEGRNYVLIYEYIEFCVIFLLHFFGFVVELIPPSYFMCQETSSTPLMEMSLENTVETLTESLQSLSSVEDVESIHGEFRSGHGNWNVEANAPSSTKDLPVYEMKGEKRGICLIINNSKFTDLNPRKGTEVDEMRLIGVFEWLGFTVEIERDRKCSDIKNVLEKMRSRDHSDMDCFACCVLSHGLEGFVYGVDEECVKLREIMEPFSGHRCSSLVGKPKLFFVQACQGTKEQTPVFLQSDGTAASSISNDSWVPKDSIPDDADFLLGMATVPDYASFRDVLKGTWYIQSLCDKLQLLVPQRVDLLSILTEVNNEVSMMTDQRGVKKQMPQPVFSLRKKVIFPIPSGSLPMEQSWKSCPADC
ncbi:caspase-8 isoform X2 [Denticeps clupeoides]|uniref:caspase-8 isoform X2 n=1 Tax=Denticeps clupeoides TaxID=299321 RepID=UPI0010A476C5|nr:caspase-8-like isoform X2 [Denticeps clupeoides]